MALRFTQLVNCFKLLTIGQLITFAQVPTYIPIYMSDIYVVHIISINGSHLIKMNGKTRNKCKTLRLFQTENVIKVKFIFSRFLKVIQMKILVYLSILWYVHRFSFQIYTFAGKCFFYTIIAFLTNVACQYSKLVFGVIP